MTEEPQFEVGQVIHHRKFGYRGVIVDLDAHCQADDDWYDFQTQGAVDKPTKAQPWYHVLVDGASHTTYVAQSNLQEGAADRPVEHPLLEKFFSSFFNGRYYKENLN